MSESKHTPGPWHVGGVWIHDDDTIYSGAMPVARVFRKRRSGIAIKGSWEANARLIAAAPEMAHELKELAVLYHMDQCMRVGGSQSMLYDCKTPCCKSRYDILKKAGIL